MSYFPTKVTVVASEPSGGTEGDMYYNTSDSTLYIYASGAWAAISGGGGSDGTFDFMDGNDLQFMDGNSAAYMSG